jgi:hypothetical protein
MINKDDLTPDTHPQSSLLNIPSADKPCSTII